MFCKRKLGELKKKENVGFAGFLKLLIIQTIMI